MATLADRVGVNYLDGLLSSCPELCMFASQLPVQPGDLGFAGPQPKQHAVLGCEDLSARHVPYACSATALPLSRMSMHQRINKDDI